MVSRYWKKRYDRARRLANSAGSEEVKRVYIELAGHYSRLMARLDNPGLNSRR